MSATRMQAGYTKCGVSKSICLRFTSFRSAQFFATLNSISIEFFNCVAVLFFPVQLLCVSVGVRSDGGGHGCLRICMCECVLGVLINIIYTHIFMYMYIYNNLYALSSVLEREFCALFI